MKKMTKETKNNLITYAGIILIYIAVQIAISGGKMSSLMEGLLVPVCTYLILAVSLNLTVGILGELSLGHAGFMCVGAFSSAFFSKCTEDVITNAPLRFFFAILIGAAAAAVMGMLVGIPVLRLKGDYLAIVTLAFGEIIKNFINVIYVGKDSNGFHFSMKDSLSLGLEEDGVVIIKGAQGITGTPQDSNFTIAVVLILITVFIITNLVNSRTGRAVMSIRDNRIAAESVGINITKYRMLAFVVSAALAGMAGALYGLNYSTIQAVKFKFDTSILVLVFVVLGGIGNIRGSIIAATVLTVLPEMLREFGNYRMLIYAIVLILVMLVSNNPMLKSFVDDLIGKFKKNKEKEGNKA